MNGYFAGQLITWAVIIVFLAAMYVLGSLPV